MEIIMQRTKKIKKPSGLALDVLEFIEIYIVQQGYPPTVREIQAATGIKTPSHVNFCLSRLEKTGYIERDKGVSRGIRLVRLPRVESNPQASRRPYGGSQPVVPLYGYIAAGEPIHIYPMEDPESVLEIPAHLVPPRVDPKELFALTVKGDSMIDALVTEGDQVILMHADKIENGDMVAAWLPVEEATTLKYFYREKNGICLMPANPNYAPQYFKKSSEILVQGKVIAILRKV
jgi:repressor LexA